MPKSRLFWSLSSNYLRMLFDIVLVLMTIPVLLHAFGSEVYGRWVISLSVFQLVTLLDAGMSQHLFRIVASQHEQASKRRSTLLAIQIFFVSISLPIALLVTLKWHWLGLMILAGLLLQPFRLLQSWLNGKHQIAQTNISYLVGRSLYGAGLLVLVLSSQATFSAVVLLFLLSQAIEMCLSFWFVWRNSERILPPRSDFSWTTMKDELQQAQPFFWINVSSLLFTRLEPIVIGSMFGYKWVALYDVAWRLAFYFFTFCRQVIHAFSPLLAQKKDALYASLQRTLQVSGAIAFPLFAFSCLHKETLFRAWLGQVSPITLSVFVPLLVVMLMTLLQATLSTTLGLQGEERSVALYLILRSALQLTVSVVGGLCFGWQGYVGGMVLAVVLLDGWVWVRYAGAKLKLSGVMLWSSFVKQSALPVAITIGVALLLPPFFQSQPRIALISHTLVEMGTYTLLFLGSYCVLFKPQQHDDLGLQTS